MRISILLLIPLGLGIAACDTTGHGSQESDFVVEAILVSGELLPTIRLSRVTAIDQEYDFLGLGTEGARIELDLLDESGSVQSTYQYEESPQFKGIYYPQSWFARVQPLRAYRLRATLEESSAAIMATTVTPDTFNVVNATLSTAVYQALEQLELTVTRSSFPGREQNFYVFVTEALDPKEEELTPLAAARLGDDVSEESLESMSLNGSPILSEDNYDLNPDGTLTVRYPWIGINFFGTNRIHINALDDNLYDFFRSQSVQQGGSTLAPGEIPNPIERITGAHGVFGAYASVSFDLEVLRQ